jgi:molybdenum cofactor synthesis domain-containing protein
MKSVKTAAICLIGNELLSGSVVDQNLPYIAIELKNIGIRVRETRVVADVEQDIVDAVNALRHRYDYVITTGGIGPTHDDITSDSIATAFGVNNVVNKEAFDTLQWHFDKKGIEFTEAAQRMAHAPEGAELIKNKASVAPGYRIGNVFVFAGVPSIMQSMLSASLPLFESSNPIISRSIHAKASESSIAKTLDQIQQEFPEIEIGSYPQPRSASYSVILIIQGVEQEKIDLAYEKICNACNDLAIDYKRD